MAENYEITSPKNGVKSSNEFSSLITTILVCDCGKFHEFYLNFGKEPVLVFLCEGNKKCINLNHYKNDIKFSRVCNLCRGQILVHIDYWRKDKSIFLCEKCYNKKQKKGNYTQIKTIFSNKDENDIGYKVWKKISDFIDKNVNKGENEFYSINLSKIKLFMKFISYLYYMKQLYNETSDEYEIITKALEYSNYLIDIAIKNIEIYDLYHFNKECIIYGYSINNGIIFLSKKFKRKYEDLIQKCNKGRYLSIEMLKYIYSKYMDMKLINEDEISIIEEEYVDKNLNQDIGKTIFLEALECNRIYIAFKSILSELEHDYEIIDLKINNLEIKEELHLNKYINSFLNIPGQFSIIRKGINVILDKIIKNNHEKLKFIKPSEKIVNLVLNLIKNIFKKLKNSKNKKLSESIEKKLNDLKTTLIKYKSSITETKEKLNDLSYPLIELSEEEKQLLLIIFSKQKEDNYISNISVNDGEDKELDFIINYCFELKNLTSETIHANDKSNLKFYSFPKELENLPTPSKEDTFEDAKNKIINILNMVPKYSEVSFDELINFIFYQDKERFLDMDNKVKYLLSFLDLKIDKYSMIKAKIKKLNRKIKEKSNLYGNFLININLHYNKVKYDKFINKYKIKNNSEAIFEYLDNILNFIIPDRKGVEGDAFDDDEDKDMNIMNVYNESVNKEQELRKNIITLFEKDKKFITYIPNYFWFKLKEYIDNHMDEFTQRFDNLRKNIKEKHLIYLKLDQLNDIISTIKLFTFNIKDHFDEFEINNSQFLPKKKNKGKYGEAIEKTITIFDNFINSLKKYIGDLNEKVEISSEDPGEFVFRLFLSKIGLSWS